MAIVPRRSKYGSLNWGEHQPMLKRLYLDEDKTLADVAVTMKDDYDFAPSISAYKRQFALWNWRKYSNAQISRPTERNTRKRQRESEKDTVFGFGGAQSTTTELERVVARSKRACEVSGVNDGRPATSFGVTFATPRGSAESIALGASQDYLLDGENHAPFDTAQGTDPPADAQSMVIVPISGGSGSSDGVPEPPPRFSNELPSPERAPTLLEFPLEGLDFSAPWLSDDFASPGCTAMLSGPFLEGLDFSTPWFTGDLPSPGGGAMHPGLPLQGLDFNTPRFTDDLPSPGRAYLRSFCSSSPFPIALPGCFITRSSFSLHLAGSPWSLFQRTIYDLACSTPTRVTHEVVRPSPFDLVHSILPHSNGHTGAKNLKSSLEQALSIYFPVDETQNLPLLPAFPENFSIDQLVAVSFGMIANGVLTGGELEQFLGIMKNYAPKALLRRLLGTGTSTARAASEMLLKNVVKTGDEEALNFLLDIGIRKERLSGTEGGALLRSAVYHGRTKMAKRIVLAGADPNRGDWNRVTPLLWAVVQEDLDLVKVLLEAGAEVDRPCGNSPDTPLSVAVERNNVPCVSMLLESRATVDTSTVPGRRRWPYLYCSGPSIPVLDYAYLMGYTTIYQLLLARSSTANSGLTLSGIISAARVGRSQLEAYLRQRANGDCRKPTMLLESALNSAILHNTRDMAIDVLLNFNVHPDTPTVALDRDDQLPLCQAIPDIDLVGRLIEAGADINKPAVILSATSQEENLDCLSFLIASGLDLQVLGSIGLGKAIWEDNMDIMQLLLHSGAPATGYDQSGWCIVYTAAYKRNWQALRILLQHGADVNGVGRDGSRPIHAAAFIADLEIAKVLVENGALLDHSGLRGNRFGTVLEEWALARRKLRISDVFMYLLEKGAPVNAPDVMRGPLQKNSLLTILILKSAEEDLVRLVLNKGARVNETRLPHILKARTPVQAAAEMGNLDLVRELYENGADLNAPAGLKLGRTALQAACNAKRANMELVVYLLDKGAEINAKPGYDGGLTAIQGAAIQGNIKLVALLMDRGADMNADPAIKNGRTALDGAAEHGRLDMVHLLLAAGARCDRGGLSGYDSAIELAKKEGHWAVADLLAMAGLASVDGNMY